MSIFFIDSFDDGPHWEIAILEADSEESARAILRAEIANEDARHDHQIWDPQPEEKWKVVEARSPCRFILGSGCR